VHRADFQHSVDFFQALCNMTSGVMLPLTTADLLAMTIVGSVLENMDMERLITGKLLHAGKSNELTSRNRLRSRSANQAERPIDAECRRGCSVSPVIGDRSG
jgi:hypothetical protein